MSTPIAGSRRRDSVPGDKLFEDFLEDTFQPFANDLAENLSASLTTDPVSQAFSCLDSRNFVGKSVPVTFGEEGLDKLIEWYGNAQESDFPGLNSQKNRTDQKINPNETRIEYSIFKQLMTLENEKSEKLKTKTIRKVLKLSSLKCE